VHQPAESSGLVSGESQCPAPRPVFRCAADRGPCLIPLEEKPDRSGLVAIYHQGDPARACWAGAEGLHPAVVDGASPNGEPGHNRPGGPPAPRSDARVAGPQALELCAGRRERKGSSRLGEVGQSGMPRFPFTLAGQATFIRFRQMVSQNEAALQRQLTMSVTSGTRE